MNICVYGAASNAIDKKYITAGEELGEKIAKRGHSLVYGAGATGMMGAVSRGVEKQNGSVTGVVPEFFTNEEVLNVDCTKLIRTKTMRERKQIMEDLSDAFIVTPGGIGTFEEFLEVLTLKQLNRHNKPIVLFNVDGFYNGMISMLDEAINGNFINEECREMYPAFETADAILDYIENYKEIDLSKMKV